MAVTKTNFINYSRCPRYLGLEEIKKEGIDADISYQEYLEQEKNDKIQELFDKMYEETDDGEVDLIDKINPQLEAMMTYYNEVESIAGKLSTKVFGGSSIYSKDTKRQECFDFTKNGIHFLCYVDIYNETEESINIIEVKASTTKKYLELGATLNKEFSSIFERCGNILFLKEEIPGKDISTEMKLENYEKQRSKLFNRFGDRGRYVYDLAVQRYIIESEYKQSNNENKLQKFKYYLAVLNHEYTFSGEYDNNNNPVYDKDSEGNELISYIDLTIITEEYQKFVIKDAEKIEKFLLENNAVQCDLGDYCEHKKPTKCKFFDQICGTIIPKKNSSLNYMDNPAGFKTDSGDRLKSLNLINAGYIEMLDIPESWITKENHHIQRNAVRTGSDFVDKEKIILGLKQLEYPIYHLDFETFPCPLPRFKDEKPYTQSPFQFSLHTELEPGVCDVDKDNYVFLAKTFNDEREELAKQLIEHIDPNKGTLFAQNVSFEKTQIKNLANYFPQYKSDLMKIHARAFDLIWLLKTNTALYKELGYDEEQAKRVNYYNKNLSGSYSIKKTLPVFSDLKYDDLDVKNGTEAIVVYANYPKFTKEEFDFKYNALVNYCKQDTWAMVVILNELRKIVK